ncbi:uncharacterized protein [Nicotiana sylvestris]|uniref:uncharacterized protein n=1 Tax=Nicotiana sylvestris TaxID=4096 RepID=UPI00388C78EF
MAEELKKLTSRVQGVEGGKRIEEPIDQLYERLRAAGYVTPIPAVAMENSSQWVNPNKTCAYHSGMKGHTIDECRTLKDKIQMLIDNKVIQAKEAAPNVRKNPLPDYRGKGVNVIETDEEWDHEGSIGLIKEGDDPKRPAVTLNAILVQVQLLVEVEVTASVPFEAEVTPPRATPVPFEVEVATPFIVTVATTPPFKSNAIPWDYVAEARRSLEESTGDGILCRRSFKQDPAQISIPSVLQNSEVHKNALMKVLKEAYMPDNITSGEMDNMVRVLIDGGSSLNICPLTTMKRLRKDLHEIRAGSMNVKAFDGSQSATIGEINLCLQMGPTWFDVEFQVQGISATYNLLLGRHWIHATGIVASMIHQAMKFEWNHQEIIIHGDRSNPIYTSQTIPVIKNRRRLGGKTYHYIEHVIKKDKWWSNKIENILHGLGMNPTKGLGKISRALPSRYS